MAQLNYYTYLSQASWLIIIYIIYYIYTKQNIIPGILEKIKINNYYKQINKSIKEISKDIKLTKYFIFINNK